MDTCKIKNMLHAFYFKRKGPDCGYIKNQTKAKVKNLKFKVCDLRPTPNPIDCKQPWNQHFCRSHLHIAHRMFFL